MDGGIIRRSGDVTLICDENDYTNSGLPRGWNERIAGFQHSSPSGLILFRRVVGGGDPRGAKQRQPRE